jgi:hypothetical protein
MGIKKTILLACSVALIVFLISVPITGKFETIKYGIESEVGVKSNERVVNSNSLNGSVLIDKVYTFRSPFEILLFDNLFLKKHYIYNIYVEIVTPHNCTMEITVNDPNNVTYHIFDSVLSYHSQYTRFYNIPFGTARAGSYDFNISVCANNNLNMYIKIEEGPQCLSDKVLLQDIAYYNVSRVFGITAMIPEVVLETDTMYIFYIGRVSAISAVMGIQIFMNYSIVAPDGVEFAIYSNELLANVSSLNNFKFGTAIPGKYVLKISIYSELNINVAYAVKKESQISDVIPANTTMSHNNSSAPENESSARPPGAMFNVTSFLPLEWTMGTIVSTGCTAGALTFVTIYYKKKNMVRLGLKK